MVTGGLLGGDDRLRTCCRAARPGGREGGRVNYLGSVVTGTLEGLLLLDKKQKL